MISAKSLFNTLQEKGWYSPEGKTDQFPVEWDKDNEAIKVDLKQEPDSQV